MHMRSFMKIKSSRNEEIILSFTDIGKSCPSRKFSASQICILTPFAKIKFSQNFRIYSNNKPLVLTYGLAPGGGGYSEFVLIRRLGPSIYCLLP